MAVTYILSPTLELDCPLVKYSLSATEPAVKPAVELIIKLAAESAVASSSRASSSIESSRLSPARQSSLSLPLLPYLPTLLLYCRPQPRPHFPLPLMHHHQYVPLPAISRRPAYGPSSCCSQSSPVSSGRQFILSSFSCLIRRP